MGQNPMFRFPSEPSIPSTEEDPSMEPTLPTIGPTMGAYPRPTMGQLGDHNIPLHPRRQRRHAPADGHDHDHHYHYHWYHYPYYMPYYYEPPMPYYEPPMPYYPSMPYFPPMRPPELLPNFLPRDYRLGLNLNPHYQYSRANYYNSLNKAAKKTN